MNEKVKVYIGNKDTGKTTRLWEIYKKAIEDQRSVLVIDSATEHFQRSLTKKVREFDKASITEIPSCGEKHIVFPELHNRFYPQELVQDVGSNTYLCDASTYLEKGYDFPQGDIREKYRLLYKRLSMQVFSALINKVNVVIMDEIELISESRVVIERAFSSGIDIYMSLHEPEGLAGLEELASIEVT